MTTRVSLIANNAVNSATINNSTIIGEDIADNTITTSKINFSQSLVPLGAIFMWSGTTAPSGYQLCNGTDLPSNSSLRPGITKTPDLRDRFIVGATDGGDNTYPGLSAGATGGSADATLVSHNHTATSTVSDPGHTHDITSTRGPRVASGGADSFRDGGTSASITSSKTGITVGTTISIEGSSATNANLPPYYALAFIMRVL